GRHLRNGILSASQSQSIFRSGAADRAAEHLRLFVLFRRSIAIYSYITGLRQATHPNKVGKNYFRPAAPFSYLRVSLQGCTPPHVKTQKTLLFSTFLYFSLLFSTLLYFLRLCRRGNPGDLLAICQFLSMLWAPSPSSPGPRPLTTDHRPPTPV